MIRKHCWIALLAIGLLGGAAGAAKTPKLAAYKGYVQVFSHVAVTVRSLHNRNALRTFSYSDALRRQMLDRHLVYGEKITVLYRPDSTLAVRLKAKQYPGS